MQNSEFLSTPEVAELVPERVDELIKRAQQEVEEGLLPAAQIAVARNGKVAFQRTFGDATDESLFAVFSCTKAIISSAIWLLMQEGKLDINERAADIVPEFGANEKDQITVKQILLHVSGFPAAPFRPTDWNERDKRLGRFSKWRLNWEPGSKFEYHPTSGMWVLAEIIERKTGQDFRDFLKERIIESLGLNDFFVGLPADKNDQVLELSGTGEPLTSEDYQRLGIPEPPVTEVTEEAILAFNHTDVRAVGVPGGGGLMTAAAMTLFYQGLLHGGSLGRDRIWTDETLNAGRTVVSQGYVDELTGISVSRALGIVVAGDEQRNFRGFGHNNSELAFGHGGAGGQVAWADPATGISFCYVTNGHDRNPIRMGRRGVSLSNRAADLSKPMG